MPTVLDLSHLNARRNWIHKELAAVQLQRFCRGFLARKRVKEKRQQQRQLACLGAVGGCANFQNLHRLDVAVHIGMLTLHIVVYI